MRIVIVGLRRSGTTIFWQTLRQDKRLMCFNEPFNPVLREVPLEIPNRSREEFIRLHRRDPKEFWRRIAPIGRIEELQEDLSDRQVDWLRYLMEAHDRVCMDTTRVHFKMEALSRIAPDAVLVHLHRDPAAMASSHLIPSGSGGRRGGWLTRRYGQAGFWTRADRFNNWGVEELIGTSTGSLFAQRLREAGLDPEAIYSLPAVGKLLAYWRVAFDRVERDGPRCFPGRFVSVRFDAFCRDPRAAIESIYASAGEATPPLDLGSIHPPHGAYQPERERWAELYRKVGIQEAPACPKEHR